MDEPFAIDYFLGDTTPIRVTVDDDVTLTGATDAWCSVKESADDVDDDAIFQIRLNAGISVIGAQTIDITPTAEQSALLSANTVYYCDLRVRLAAGSWQTVPFHLYARRPATRSVA